ncbi:MAG: stage II sporulation protein P, partial [Clostridia bacterium]|nr:stage II sporulation protein P [Clostridia bacterium]
MKNITLLASLIVTTMLVCTLFSPIISTNSLAKGTICLSAPGALPDLPEIKNTNPSELVFIQTASSACLMEKTASVPSELLPEEEPAILTPEPIPGNISETKIIKGETCISGAEINNETSYNLSEALRNVSPSDGKTVLIVHTHTSESYRPSAAYNYVPTDNSRTEDTDFNVARVGAELTSALSSYGINVIHDSSLNDYPSYNGSYQKTLNLIESHLEKNPSIDIVIDLHRDAMERSDGTKISPVCTVENGKAAQIMLVVGTDQSGLTHPNWRDNFSFAVKLQNIINKNFPGLTRPINVRRERF